MKKWMFVILMSVVLTGCGEPKTARISHQSPAVPQYTYSEWEEVQTTFDDDELITTFEESEVTASPEYWEELTYNSQKNQYWE